MNEVRRVLDKNKLLDDGEVKSAVFALLSMHYSGTDANEGGDITRLIRKELQSMVSKKDDWVCLTEDNVDTIYDAFQDTPVSDASQISQILNSSEGIKAASNDFMRLVDVGKDERVQRRASKSSRNCKCVCGIA